MEMAFSHLAILAGEALGWTGTIQDKITIWAAHQPVKNEPAVVLPTPQEDTSYKELKDHAEALYGCNGFCHVKKYSSPQISKINPPR
jgi:hypothetical protein